MNVVELIAEDFTRGVRLFIGAANMIVAGYKFIGRACWFVNEHIVVIGKWLLGMCGMGGLGFVIKRELDLYEMYEREKEQKEDAEEKNRRLHRELDKAEHTARLLRVNHEFCMTIIKYTSDTHLCDIYNVFDEKLEGLVHKCNQLRINKEIEFGKRNTL